MRVLFVTGLSGAGKSQAMKIFEDLGFYCVEHLPAAVLDATLEELDARGVHDAAIAPDVAAGEPFEDALAGLDFEVRERGARVLFLDAHDDEIVRRFSTTRRRHPLGALGSLLEAIAAERVALTPLRERATTIVDTTGLTHAALKARLRDAFPPQGTVRLNVSILAFGFRYGLPLDLDLLFDVRFLRNPNYDPHLHAVTGDDPEVAAFIEGDPSLVPFLSQLVHLTDFLLPRYIDEGKAQLTIGFGCTGGRHRSVYVARRLLAHLEGDARWTLSFSARDMER